MIKCNRLAWVVCLLPALSVATEDLVSVVNSASNYDPTYLNAVQINQSTMAQVGVSRAEFFPQVSASLQRGWVKSNGSEQFTRNNFDMTSKSDSQSHNFGLDISQSLFKLGDIESFEAAKANAGAALMNIKTARLTLLNSVATDYFNVASAQGTLAIAKEQLALEKRLYKIAKVQYKAGNTMATDQLTAHVSVLSSEDTVTSNEQTLVSALNALSQHVPTKITHVRGLTGVIKPKKANKHDLNSWVKKGLRGSPVILAQQLMVLSARKQVEENRSQNLPSLSSSYSLNKARTNTETIKSRSTSHSYSISLDIPIFSGGSMYHQTVAAKHNYYAAKDTLNQQKKLVEANISTYFLSMILSADTISRAVKSLKLYQKNYQMMLTAYLAGKETMTDVQSALGTLYSKKTTLLAQQYTFLTQYVEFKQSIGSLSMNDITEINNWMHRHVQY